MVSGCFKCIILFLYFCYYYIPSSSDHYALEWEGLDPYHRGPNYHRVIQAERTRHFSMVCGGWRALGIRDVKVEKGLYVKGYGPREYYV